MNLLKCPKCGELFSDSYKECPFCEEDEAYLSGNKRTKGRGRRVEKPKSPSILGPALVVVVLLLAGFLIYTFLGDKIAALFDGTEKPPVVDPVDPGTVLTIDKTELKLTVGDTAVLTVTGAEGYQWSSSDSAVASVDETVSLSAVSAGTSTITAAGVGAAAACVVTVEKKEEPKKDLALETIYGSLNKNGRGNWEFTASEGDAFGMMVSGTDSDVSWSSSNKSVATIASDGTFKAVGSGKAVITAEVDGQTLKCDVIVN